MGRRKAAYSRRLVVATVTDNRVYMATCTACGALINGFEQDTHTQWHERAVTLDTDI